MSIEFETKSILFTAPFFVDFNACIFEGTGGGAFVTTGIELGVISFLEEGMMVDVLFKLPNMPTSPLLY